MSTQNEKVVKTRIVHKHDIEDNWKQATNFVPKQGELIVYDERYIDKETNQEVIVAKSVRYKIGDGVRTVTALPFASSRSDAEVTLSEPFTITKDFGYYKLASGKTFAKVGETGQSLHEFLQDAFAQEDRTIFSTTPSCSISINDKTYEVGTTITPSASWSTNNGTYKWGTCGIVNTPADANYTKKTTGITYTTGSISYSTSYDTGDSTETANNVSTFILKDGVTTVTASGTAIRKPVTNRPCSNIGSDLYERLDAAYKEETSLPKEATATFTGYRPFFYGAISVAPTSDNLTSEVIRSLTNGGNYDNSKTFKIIAEDFIPDGDARPSEPKLYLKAFIVAIPRANTRSRITSVFSTTGMRINVTSSYPETPSCTIQVADARGNNLNDESNPLWNPTSYDIYIWNPASIDADTVHEFTLG